MVDAPHCWIVLEVLSNIGLGRIYVGWVVILIICTVFTALSSQQFECYEFCGLSPRHCSIYGVEAAASCLNFSSRELETNISQFQYFTSPFRRYARIVIAQPGSIQVPDAFRDGTRSNSTFSLTDVTIDAAAFRHSHFVEVAANGAVLYRHRTGFAISGSFVTLKLADGFAFQPETTRIRLELVKPATFSNRTHSQLPLEAFSNASSIASGVSMVFLTLAPGYAAFETVFLSAALVVNCVVLARFVRGYLGLDRAEYLDSWKFDIWLLAGDMSAVLGFHGVAVIFSNPLTIPTLFFPASGFLRYFSDHFVYALLISTTMFLTIFLSFTMPTQFRVRSKRYGVFVGIVSGFFAMAYFVLDALVAAEGESTGLVVSNPAAEDQYLQGLSIAGLILISVWCVIVCTVFFFNKHRIVWNKGKRLYAGRIRLRILGVRLIAGLTGVFAVYWLVVYLPITASFSSFIPIYGRGAVVDVLVASSLSCINCYIWSVIRFDASEAPPRAHHLNLIGDEEALSPKARPLWQFFHWSACHFTFFENNSHSGYYFLYELERAQFSVKHRLVAPRSFFCFETANTALALSNEVYYDAPEQSCYASIAATESGVERCYAACCTSDCGPPGEAQADADLEDEPEGYCAPRTLSVETWGYTLINSSNIAGVQAVVCVMAGEDIQSPSGYRWGVPHESIPAAQSRQHVASEALRESVSLDMSNLSANTGRISHIAVAFRGTANSANAVTDARITRRAFEAMRDRTGGYARIHSGFAQCWEQLQVHVFQQLAEAMRQITESHGTATAESIPILFTGHSLGGALAVLGAYAYARISASPIQVYTFGMPRVGNGVFVHEYNKLVPETYRVVNENDSVATIGHCFRGHVGRTVLVDRDGNSIVEPNSVERRFEPLAGGGFSVKNHFLYRYGASFDAVFKSHCATLRSFLAHEPVAAIPAAAENEPLENHSHPFG